jgi:hypothetical protein
MNNDPFEEFEFKPLTEGLGFHKKAEQVKADKDLSRLTHDRVSRSVPERPPVSPQPSAQAMAPSGGATTFTGTLNAANANLNTTASAAAPTPASDSISKIMSTLPPSFGSPSLDFLEEKKPATRAAIPGSLASQAPPLAPAYKNAEFQSRLEESFAKAFPKSAVRTRAEAKSETETKKRTLKSAMTAAAPVAPAPFSTTGGALFARAASIPSAIVDGFAVLGISVLCLVIILMLTKADLVGLLTNAQTDGPAQMHLVILFVVMLQLYMLVCRSFVGATLGEWSFDTQLGSNDDQQQSAYPLKVVGRTLLITATAFVLPVLSALLNRDLMAPLTGLSLFSHDENLS